MAKSALNPKRYISQRKGNNMVIEDKSFNAEEVKLLSSMRGKILGSIDAVIVAREDTAWNIVRLHLDGMNIDLVNSLEDITVDELGTLEEFGLLKVEKTDCETLDIPEASSDTTIFPIEESIKDVKIVSNCIDIFGNAQKVATIRYPQAVIIETESDFIVLDKEVWFSETITIKRGKSIDGLIYDESQNWEDDPEEDPSTHYEFRTEIVSV